MRTRIGSERRQLPGQVITPLVLSFALYAPKLVGLLLGPQAMYLVLDFHLLDTCWKGTGFPQVLSLLEVLLVIVMVITIVTRRPLVFTK